MQTDTITYDTWAPDTVARDTLDERPLPQWLRDQKEGRTTVQPTPIVMKEDHSLKISFILTIIFIILAVVILTLYMNRKHKKQAS
jgi:hypothetical protein